MVKPKSMVAEKIGQQRTHGRRRCPVQYLVMMETIEEKLPTAPEELAKHGERVIASQEVMIELKKAGKVLAGGVPVGRKAAVAIVEAESNDELSELLMRIPVHSISDTKVVPLASHESVARAIRREFEHRKASP
jgi:muconolactone delta-isomerase